MAELLNIVSTRSTSANKSHDETRANEVRENPASPAPIRPDTALKILDSQPQLSSLIRVISYLVDTTTVKEQDGFNILLPGPRSFQIVFIMVDEIVPNFWPTFRSASAKAEKQSKRDLVRILRSTSGLSATLASIRASTQEIKGTGLKQADRLSTLCHFLEALLSGDSFMLENWRTINEDKGKFVQADLLWKENLQLITSGRIVSVSAEADILLQEKASTVRSPIWTSEGTEYAQWLGLNLLRMVKGMEKDAWDTSGKKAVVLALSKSLSLGYNDRIVANLCKPLIYGDEASLPRLRSILQNLSSHEQKMVLFSIIRTLSQHLSNHNKERISGAAALISVLCEDSSILNGHLATWLASPSPESINHEQPAHRAVLSALAVDLNRLKSTLWRALDIFSDKLFIKHSPMIHQEVNTQIVLMLLGSVYKADPGFLKTVSKSSVYLSSISNHLGASSVRSKFFGMVVAFTLSEVMDEPDKRLKFTSDGFDSDEWNRYKSIFRIQDPVGSIQDLRPAQKGLRYEKTQYRKSEAVRRVSSPRVAENRSSRVIAIEELEDDSDAEATIDASNDDDLPLYSKPDTDPSDDDEDPTLVQRNKPVAPVYIRELLAGLRDTEDYDKHTLALEHAADLIRRKASFGTEVSDHLDDLATEIAGLKDRWEKDDFTSLRLQAMTAILIANPLEMGPRFAQSFYSGDYSISQRGAMLTAIGLAAREIAGVGQDDALVTGAELSKNSFPSKRLPERLHQHYALEAAAPMDKLTQQLSRSMIQPLAASAADQATGPNALKVRTFSSRLDVEKRRLKPTSNPLSKIVAQAFFFPLTARWQVHIHAVGDHAPQASPMLVSQLLKTLSLVLHAAGPANPALPQLTNEFWDFLLDMRLKADDKSVLEALLFSLLMLLEVNADNERRLAEDHAKQLFETQEWVSEVLEKTRGEGEEEGRYKMLAAGIVVRCREIIEKHQRLLVGDMMNLMD